jgi:signal transduction histidine kinase
VRLTPRELATRAFAVAVLVAGWTATILLWPERRLTTSVAVTLVGCAAASAWLLRHGVRMSVAGWYATLEDLVLVPLVLVYPVGWVMAVGAASGLAMAWGTPSHRTRWYRAVFNSGALTLLAYVSFQAARSMPGEGAVGTALAAIAAALTWGLLSNLITTVAVLVERGGPVAECYRIDDSVLTLRRVPGIATFAVVVYQARAGDWPVLAAVALVLAVQQMLSRAVHVDVMATEYEAEREQLLRLVASAGDRQRREVTSQIHDGPLQVVVATRVLLDSMTSRRENGAPPDPDQLKALSGHLTGAIDELRSALREGYRDRLVVAGVRDGLTEILREHEPTFPAGYRLTVDDQLDLSVDVSVPLLLILREAIVNAAHHSRSNIVTVTVCAEGDTVVGEVLDEGVGIESWVVSVRRRQGHLGLSLMQERAERAGGTVIVERRETAGTRVRVTLPLPRPAHSERPLEDWERTPQAQPGS